MQNLFIELSSVMINIERITFVKKIPRNQGESGHYLEIHSHNEIFYVWDPEEVNVVWNQLKQYKTKISP